MCANCTNLLEPIIVYVHTPLIAIVAPASFEKKYGKKKPPLHNPHKTVSSNERIGFCETQSGFFEPQNTNKFVSTKMKISFIQKDDFILQNRHYHVLCLCLWPNKSRYCSSANPFTAFNGDKRNFVRE